MSWIDESGASILKDLGEFTVPLAVTADMYRTSHMLKLLED